MIFPSTLVGQEELKARILDINPEYKFTYYKSINPDDDYIL